MTKYPGPDSTTNKYAGPLGGDVTPEKTGNNICHMRNEFVSVWQHSASQLKSEKKEKSGK